MTHCDVIALLSHCKPMEIGIQQRFCKFVANIFQNGTPVLRTIVSTALNNPLSVFCSNYNTVCGHGNMNCLEVRANLYKDWLASLFGGLICNANALRELLGMRDCTHVSVLSFDETRDFIKDICLNWDCTSLHHVSLPVIYSLIFDILSQFTSIHCDCMCFYLFIYPSHMLFFSMCFIVPYLLIYIHIYKPNIYQTLYQAYSFVWKLYLLLLKHFANNLISNRLFIWSSDGWVYWQKYASLGPVSIQRPDIVPKMSANGSAVSMKAALPLLKILATASCRSSKSGPWSSMCNSQDRFRKYSTTNVINVVVNMQQKSSGKHDIASPYFLAKKHIHFNLLIPRQMWYCLTRRCLLKSIWQHDLIITKPYLLSASSSHRLSKRCWQWKTDRLWRYHGVR